MEVSKNKTNRLKSVTAIILAGTALTSCEQQAAADSKSTPPNNESSISSYSTTTPTLSVSTLLEKAWAAALKEYPGQIDIAVYNHATKETAHYTNAPGKKFVTASTIKLSILEKILLDNQATGRTMTDYQMAQAIPMITQSDNGSASILWNEAGGGAAMQDFFEQIGTTDTVANAYGSWGVTITTAADQLKVAEQIANTDTVLTPSSITIANELLDNVNPEQRWGVPGGVPAGIIARVKNGWLDDASAGNDFADTSYWTNNSVGYIEGELNGKKIKYSMAEFSSGNPDEESGEKTLTHLATIAWKIISATSHS